MLPAHAPRAASEPFGRLPLRTQRQLQAAAKRRHRIASHRKKRLAQAAEAGAEDEEAEEDEEAGRRFRANSPSGMERSRTPEPPEYTRPGFTHHRRFAGGQYQSVPF